MNVRNTFPKVYKFVEPKTGNPYWQVDARSKKYGLNERPKFGSEKEALDKARSIAEQVAKFGAQPEVPVETKRQAEAYQKLVDRLAPIAKTPEQAVDHFLQWHGEEILRQAKPLVRALVDEYEKHKLIEKHDGQYVNELKTACRYIRRAFGDQKIDALRKNRINEQLTKDKPHKGTRAKYLTHLRMFLNWVLHEDKGYISTNPADGIKYKLDKFSKEYFNPEQIKALLKIVKHECPQLLGYYALLAFCGLRPSEGARVTWGDINTETKQLRVSDEGKTGERYIELLPVALAWVEYHRKQTPKGMPFVPDANLFNLERQIREAYRKQNNDTWYADGLRHGFATFYNSKIQNDPAVAWYMGNSVSTIKKHYAKRLPQPELDAFFGMTPDVVFA